MWFVGVTSGVVGALLACGILLMTGVTDNSVTVVGANTSLGSAPPTRESSDATPLLSYVSPSIVGLSVTGDQGTVIASGIIVDSTVQYAYILTDSALFAQAGPGPQIQVMVSSTIRSGSLVAVDPAAGIAVVRSAVSPVRTADLGSVGGLQTGDDVYAIGSAWAAATYPNGSGNYFASGEINDTLNYLPPVNGATYGLFSMLVADLSVDPSAYGGALCDDTGKVIGILNPASAELNKPGVTYVTPIDTAMEELYPLITTGRPVPHPWLGIMQASDAATTTSQGGTAAVGVSVASLAPGSPAARAGIQENDVLSEIDSTAVPSTGVLISFLDSAKPGQVVKVIWLHDGLRRHADLTLGVEPASVDTS
jgi:S1-C subfamily serine protease